MPKAYNLVIFVTTKISHTNINYEKNTNSAGLQPIRRKNC